MTVHAPVLVDGAWQFSAAWLEELRAELERGIEAADPLDPGVNAPVEPWAAEVLARLRSSGKDRSSTAQARARASASARLRLPRSRPSSKQAAPAPVKVADAELARFLERKGG